MTSSRFDPGWTSIRPQKPWTSLIYGSMNGPGLKTLLITWHIILYPDSAHAILDHFINFKDYIC